jgi:hypothetical protein
MPVLAKPATVIRWHRKGFRIYWRRRSRRAGRPKTSADIRGLIRRMGLAKPLWGAPRIHGEPVKLGIEISQAKLGRHMLRRPKEPCSTWRSFLKNHMTDIAAVDMFVVAAMTLKLLYTVVVLDDNYRIRDASYGLGFRDCVRAMGIEEVIPPAREGVARLRNCGVGASSVNGPARLVRRDLLITVVIPQLGQI